MYKTLGTWLLRRNVAKLNAGDYKPTLAMYADDATLAFPGDNGFARQFRPVEKGLDAHVTHRGKAEIEAFLQRFVASGIQLELDDILMAGPPWHIRMAARGRAWAPGPGGTNVYTNRAVLYVVMRWGKIVEHEDYEDCERAAAYSEHLGLSEVSA